MHRQGVNVRRHQRPESLVNESLCSDPRQTLESIGNDYDLEVPASRRGAGVPGMRGTVVDHLDVDG
jgi:hypothetical protein